MPSSSNINLKKRERWGKERKNGDNIETSMVSLDCIIDGVNVNLNATFIGSKPEYPFSF